MNQPPNPSPHDLTEALEKLIGSSVEQHALIDAMKYINEQNFVSSIAVKETFLELLPPEALLHPSCMTASLLYMHLRSLLTMHGIIVERRQGLAVYQAVAAAMYACDNGMVNMVNPLISNWKHSKQTAAAPEAAQSTSSGVSAVNQDTESTWRRVDAAEKCFSEAHKYSGILGESPSLSEAKRAYLTYCDQKGFPRTDRVILVS